MTTRPTRDAGRRGLRAALAACVLAALPSGATGAHAATVASRRVAVLVPTVRIADRLHAALHDDGMIRVEIAARPLQDLEHRAARKAAMPGAALLTADDAATACAEGLLVRIGAAGGCAGPTVANGFVLATTDPAVGHAPRWDDLWEVARMPGRRGLREDAVGTLEIALLADGVAPGDVYATLGSAAGADRAFRKLDQLRPYVDWWSTGAEARRALLSGAVLMTVVPATDLPRDPPRDRPLLLGDRLRSNLVWVRPRGAASAPPDGTDADDVFAEPPLDRLGPALSPTGTLSGTAAAGATRPTPPLAVDDRFWLAHAALRERFRAWLAL